MQSTPQTLKGKALKAGSQAVGRLAGKKRVSDEERQQREEVCVRCDVMLVDDAGQWCGELLRLRFGKDTKKRKGCGCLLNTKRLYKNFDCPKGLWLKEANDGD